MVSDQLFPAALSAGAILSGFCGTFLTFRVQREANYYRQIFIDPSSKEPEDIYVGMSHFPASLTLLARINNLCSSVRLRTPSSGPCWLVG